MCGHEVLELLARRVKTRIAAAPGAVRILCTSREANSKRFHDSAMQEHIYAGDLVSCAGSSL